MGALALISDSRAAAEDAVQEALARAWERSERGEHIRSPAAWVTTVALNLTRSRLRKLRVERRAREEMEPATSAADPDQALDVRRALAALPRRQREATVLRYYLGHDVAVVARILGVNEGTAKTTLFRARKALAAALGEREEADVAGL